MTLARSCVNFFSAWKFLNYQNVVAEFETNSGIICSILSSFGCVGLARSLGVGQIFDMCTQEGFVCAASIPGTGTFDSRDSHAEAVLHSGGDGCCHHGDGHRKSVQPR